MDIDIALLIAKSKRGDNSAFSQLYSIYATDLYRFAVYMMGNEQDAEDAVQEAVFSAWRNIHTLNDESLFKAWLFKILTNRCKTNLMKKNKVPDSLPIEEYTFLQDTQSSSFVSAELKEALAALTPPDAQIILLSIIGGFKSSELAEIYNMPAATIRTRQKRALGKLKEILS